MTKCRECVTFPFCISYFLFCQAFIIWVNGRTRLQKRKTIESNVFLFFLTIFLFMKFLLNKLSVILFPHFILEYKLVGLWEIISELLHLMLHKVWCWIKEYSAEILSGIRVWAKIEQYSMFSQTADSVGLNIVFIITPWRKLTCQHQEFLKDTWAFIPQLLS